MYGGKPYYTDYSNSPAGIFSSVFRNGKVRSAVSKKAGLYIAFNYFIFIVVCIKQTTLRFV